MHSIFIIDLIKAEVEKPITEAHFCKHNLLVSLDNFVNGETERFGKPGYCCLGIAIA